MLYSQNALKFHYQFQLSLCAMGWLRRLKDCYHRKGYQLNRYLNLILLLQTVS